MLLLRAFSIGVFTVAPFLLVDVLVVRLATGSRVLASAFLTPLATVVVILSVVLAPVSLVPLFTVLFLLFFFFLDGLHFQVH